MTTHERQRQLILIGCGDDASRSTLPMNCYLPSRPSPSPPRILRWLQPIRPTPVTRAMSLMAFMASTTIIALRKNMGLKHWPLSAPCATNGLSLRHANGAGPSTLPIAQRGTLSVYAECGKMPRLSTISFGGTQWPATLGERPTYEVIWAFLSRYALTQTASST